MSEMKDSGIEWIGKIPEHWEPTRLKFITKIRKEKDFMPENACYIGLENIKSGYNELIDTETTYDEGKQSICKTGDVLFNKLRPYLNKVFIAPYDAYCTNELLVFSDYLGSKKYLRYLMSSQLFIEKVMSITEGTKMPRADGDEILSFWIINPPLEEQQQIVSYLDVRCSKIDGAIAQRKAIIEKLKDYKSAVITKAVTKGLNLNVEMKNSGIEWIGKIPKDWIVKRIKFIANTGSGTTPNSKTSEYYENGALNWIQSGDLYNKVYIDSVSKKITELATKECRLTYYQAPFIVIAMYGASIGNVSISLIDGYTNQACCVVIPKYCDNIKFLYYILSVAKTNLIAGSMGGTQPNISQEKIRELRIPIPQIQEQQQIVDYLDSQCAKIDEAIEKQEQAVAKLEEYRKSIIYYAVTGKIDCRDI